MSLKFKRPVAVLLATVTAIPLATSVSAQSQGTASSDITVTAEIPDLATLPAGPEIKGIISARKGDRIQVSTADGQRTPIALSDTTQVKNAGLFSSRDKTGTAALLNGLPVTVKTRQWNGGLVASQVTFKKNDAKLASMIHNGTDQRFGEQAAATEALRGRVGDIDNYLIKGTTNVNFDTGKTALSEQAKSSLCQAATQAEATNNALLLVVGYTDATGSQEYNQQLSEKRASTVINYLQQACHWKPYRMLTPTGMAMADPVADNSTPEGKAQNRRVAVNIMVSKAVEGM
ncbi:MAG TPA: OmpA family protein [Sphingomonas sp.]|jgi:outer membrane protein OmpA-like peptidoglycan-associated protein|nr:OmpA family protein [Sphingomonas sp.]